MSKSSKALETESDLAEAGSGNGVSFQVVVEFLCALMKMFGNEIAVLCSALCSLKTLGHTLVCVFSVRVVSPTSWCGLKTTSCSLCSKAGILTPVLLWRLVFKHLPALGLAFSMMQGVALSSRWQRLLIFLPCVLKEWCPECTIPET